LLCGYYKIKTGNRRLFMQM